MEMINSVRIAVSGTLYEHAKILNNWFSAKFAVSTAVTMKNDVFWDVTPFGSCKTLDASVAS
jgi:hypothetical protein